MKSDSVGKLSTAVFICFFPFANVQGLHKMLRTHKVKTLKQTLEMYQKSVSWGDSRLWVLWKHRNASVKIPPCSPFSSPRAELETLIPIITESHAWFPLRIVCATLNPCFVTSPSSSRRSPNPFSVLSTAAPAPCSSRKATVFLHCLGHHQQHCQTVCRDSLWYFVCGRAPVCVPVFI